MSSRSATGSTSRPLRQGTVDRRDAGIWTGGQCVNSSQVNTGVARPTTPDEANLANPSLRTDSAGGHKRLFARVRHHIKDAISERDSC
jgi:hypothetical protein